LGSGEVVPAWDLAVSTMSLGERTRFVVPPEYAYGERGFEGLIPPNETIELDIELVGFY
jgi:FK506-binding protein 1